MCLSNVHGASVTSAVRLARLPTEAKDHSAQNVLSTPNTIYMPKAAPVRFTGRTTASRRSPVAGRKLWVLERISGESPIEAHDD